jgi:uncharacterized damage-inducible protein DinB
MGGLSSRRRERHWASRFGEAGGAQEPGHGGTNPGFCRLIGKTECPIRSPLSAEETDMPNTPAADVVALLRIQARANRLANHRLHRAMAALTDDEFSARRTSFFPSLAQTLNHLLAVDVYYLAALEGQPDMAAQYRAFVAATGITELARRQADADQRLIAYCDALDAASAEQIIAMDRESHIQQEKTVHLLMHLFNHQVHHRGQAHAMLAGTAVKPPQLDEFMMPSEFALRRDDMAALGWTEATAYGDQAWPAG